MCQPLRLFAQQAGGVSPIDHADERRMNAVAEHAPKVVRQSRGDRTRNGEREGLLRPQPDFFTLAVCTNRR